MTARCSGRRLRAAAERVIVMLRPCAAMLEGDGGCMIAFRVQLNEEEALTAGLSGLHAMTVFVGSAERDPKYQPPGAPRVDVRMHVGGLRNGPEGLRAHIRWSERLLRVGDTVTITVVEASESDISRLSEETPAAELTERGEREQLAYLLKKYGAP